MNLRRLGLVLVTSSALTVAACSSSTSGTGSTSAPTATSSGSGTSTASGAASGAASGGSTAAGGPSSAAPSAATNPEALASLLQQGLNATSSAHITLRVTTGGTSIAGSGDEKLVDGKPSALRLTETIPGVGALEIIQVSGKTYAKLPGRLNTSGKPYVLITTTSTNPTVRTLAASLQSAQSSASIGSAGLFASAAGSIKVVGMTTVGGVRTTHYAVVVDSTKLPSTYPGKSALLQAGVRTLPVELYVDSSGRPVEVAETFSISGTTVDSQFTTSNFNQPVTIAAPPAAQVSTK